MHDPIEFFLASVLHRCMRIMAISRCINMQDQVLLRQSRFVPVVIAMHEDTAKGLVMDWEHAPTQLQCSWVQVSSSKI